MLRNWGGVLLKHHGIPVYLYEAAATSPQRKSLGDIRSGEYEGLVPRLSILPGSRTMASRHLMLIPEQPSSVCEIFGGIQRQFEY